MREGELILSLPYVAGFFDGEGSVGIYRAEKHGRERFHMHVTVTQNRGEYALNLFGQLMAAYGGSVGNSGGQTGKKAMAWQIGSNKAARFLGDIAPYLVLKRVQAEFSVAWQAQRKLVRNSLGHTVYRSEPDIEFDRQACRLLKALKVDSLEAVLTAQPDLTSTAQKLRAGWLENRA